MIRRGSGDVCLTAFGCTNYKGWHFVSVFPWHEQKLGKLSCPLCVCKHTLLLAKFLPRDHLGHQQSCPFPWHWAGGSSSSRGFLTKWQPHTAAKLLFLFMKTQTFKLIFLFGVPETIGSPMLARWHSVKTR